LNKIDKAIEYYKSILDIKPDENFINYNIALAYLKLENYIESEKFTLKELEINPNNEEAVSLLIKLVSERLNNETLKIIKVLKKINHNINSSFIYTALGLYYYKLNNITESKKFFKHATDITPNNSVALNNLGYIYFTEQDFDKAEDCYKKAVLYDDTHIQAYFNLAELYELINQPEKSIEIFNKVLNINSNINAVNFNLGRLYYKLNNKNESKKFLNIFLDNHKNKDNFYNEANEILNKINFLN
jgi:tetratricopeptide (TPR) repeat protein